MNFDLAIDLRGQIEGQGTGYRISSQIYVRMLTNMVSRDDWPPWVACKTVTFDLGFDLQGQIQGQGKGYRIPDIVPKLRQHACQNDFIQWLASLGSIHYDDL